MRDIAIIVGVSLFGFGALARPASAQFRLGSCDQVCAGETSSRHACARRISITIRTKLAASGRAAA
jgi:hypothetical protein